MGPDLCFIAGPRLDKHGGRLLSNRKNDKEGYLLSAGRL